MTHRSSASPDLLAAVKELMCWLERGKTAEQAGAKCETLNEALTQAQEAILKAEKEPTT